MSKDYKKLYEEALERAKYLKENTDSVGALDISTCFEQIFPELKESEDEMIRKAIIKHLISFSNGCYKRPSKDIIDNWISWLEKQDIKTIPKNIDDAALQYVDTCTVDGEVTHDNITEPYWNNHSMIAAYKAGWLENQGKKSEYDPYKATVESIAKMCKNYSTSTDLHDFYDNVKVKCKDAMEYNKTWTEKQGEQKHFNDNFPSFDEAQGTPIVKKQGEQKTADKEEELTEFERAIAVYIMPQLAKYTEEQIIQIKSVAKTIMELAMKESQEQKTAWSEEDKIISNEIQCLIGNYRTGDDEHKLCSWIDNLKERVQPQPKQEWDEEDEKMKSLIISTLTSMGTLNLERYHHMNLDEVKNWLESFKDRVQPQPKQEWSKEDKEMLNNCIGLMQEIDCTQEEQNWLKSLKPHWKPSEEQMEAFEHFVRSIGESGYASPYDNNTKLIHSLLNDLKNL